MSTDDSLILPAVEQVSKEDKDEATANEKLIFELAGNEAILQSIMIQNTEHEGYVINLDFDRVDSAAVKALISAFLGQTVVNFNLRNGTSLMQLNNVEVTAMYGFKNLSLKTYTQPTIT